MNRAEKEQKPLACKGREYTSLEKGLVLLTHLATNDGTMTLGELARHRTQPKHGLSSL